jgi:hypothetical protein
MRHLLTILPLCVACASPTYTTKHGINVYCEAGDDQCWTKEDVEIATELFASEANQWWLPVVLDGVNMHIVDGAFGCDTSNPDITSCYGQVGKDKTMTITYNSCISRSSFAHESAHLIQLFITDVVDPYHKDQTMYPNTCTNGDFVVTQEEIDCIDGALQTRANRRIGEYFAADCWRH